MDWLICVVVIFDVLNTIFIEIIRLIKSNKKDEKPISALVIIVILLAIMLGIICTIHMIKFKYRRRDEHNITHCEKGKKWLIVVLQSVAVCCYFWGDNFYYVMKRYGKCLSGCGENCIHVCYYVAVGFSGCGAILYAVVKVLQLAMKDNTGQSKAKEEWIDYLPMIAVIAEMDLLYTIASSKLTGTGEDVASIILWVVAIIIGITLIGGKAEKLWKKINKWNHPVPIDAWIRKLDDNQVEDIGQWNINDTWRGLQDQLSDNKFILMKGDMDNNINGVDHSTIVNTIRRNLANVHDKLVTAQENPNNVEAKGNLRDSLNTLNNNLTQHHGLRDFAFLKINNRHKYLICVMTILIIIPLVLHTLGDNLEPLDSFNRIKCNSTVNCQSEDSCETNSIIRLVLAGVSLAIISGIALYCFFNWLKSLCRPRTQEEMDKWVQYKQQYNNLHWRQRLCCWRCYQPPAHGNAGEGTSKDDGVYDGEEDANGNQIPLLIQI